jgi:integrase
LDRLSISGQERKSFLTAGIQATIPKPGKPVGFYNFNQYPHWFKKLGQRISGRKKKATIRDFKFHDLGHIFATRLVQSGNTKPDMTHTYNGMPITVQRVCEKETGC